MNVTSERGMRPTRRSSSPAAQCRRTVANGNLVFQVDLDALRLRFRLFGDHDLQHPMPAGGPNAIGVNRLRQRESSVKSPLRRFPALPLQVACQLILGTVSDDGQHSLLQRNFHPVWIDPGDVQLQYKSIYIFFDICRGNPIGGGRGTGAGIARRVTIEVLIQMALQLTEDGPWFIARSVHVQYSVWLCNEKMQT